MSTNRERTSIPPASQDVSTPSTPLKKSRETFPCPTCDKTYSTKRNMIRHNKTHEGDSSTSTCLKCGKSFTQRYNLERHIKRVHTASLPTLQTGGIRKRKTPVPPTSDIPLKQQKIAQPTFISCGETNALGVFRTVLLKPEKEELKKDMKLFLQDVGTHLSTELHRSLEKLRAIKYYIAVFARFNRIGGGEEEQTTTSFFRSNCHTIFSSEGEFRVSEALEKVKSSFEAFQTQGSGWVLDEILHLELKAAKCQPLASS